MNDKSTSAKALAMLTPREKRRGLLVLGLIVLKAIADTVSVASVIPFLTVLGKPEIVEENALVSKIFNGLGFTSVDAFLIALGFAVVAMMVAGAILRSVATYAINIYIGMRQYSLSRRLIETYLRQPYEYFLSRHSGDMSTNIIVEASRAVTLFYQPALELLNQGVSFLFLVSLLLFADPLMTLLAILLLGGAYALVFFAVRSRLKIMGEEVVRANKQRFRLTSEILSGVKQIKITGRDQGYVERFSEPSLRIARLQAITTTLQTVPRFALEVLAFGGIIVLTLTLIARFGGVGSGVLSDLLPLLGLYAFAGYRLMPSLQSGYAAFSKLRLGSAPINQLYHDLMGQENLNQLSSSPPDPLKLNSEIRLENVTYTYPGDRTAGLKGISFKVPRGTSVGIVGSTGAGKTTLVDVILGLLPLQDGGVLIDGQKITDKNIRAWQANIGYVPQEIYLSDATVKENIAFGIPPEQIDTSRVERAARDARIHDFIVSELPGAYNTMIGERGLRLSGGQRQRLGIARALYHDPDIVIFDEATSALDTVTENEVMASVNSISGAKTVLMIAHRLSTVRDCDKIIFMEKGSIVGEGDFQTLNANNTQFRKLASLLH